MRLKEKSKESARAANSELLKEQPLAQYLVRETETDWGSDLESEWASN